MSRVAPSSGHVTASLSIKVGARSMRRRNANGVPAHVPASIAVRTHPNAGPYEVRAIDASQCDVEASAVRGAVRGGGDALGAVIHIERAGVDNQLGFGIERRA